MGGDSFCRNARIASVVISNSRKGPGLSSKYKHFQIQRFNITASNPVDSFSILGLVQRVISAGQSVGI